MIITYFSEFFSLLNEMAPYLVLGLFFAGILHVYFSKEKIAKYLGGDSTKSAINASILGIPLPLCSCGVIPTGVSFHKNGASKGASVSFLISTPQTGVDSVLATYSLMGWPFAVIRPLVALFTGISGGLLTNIFAKDKPAEAPMAQPTPGADISCADGCDEDTPQDQPVSAIGKVKQLFRYAFVEFLQDISDWLLIGLALAALISVALPDTFFTEYVTNDYWGILIALVASVPMYICATGSIPIAATLLMKGISPGAALVFLMAGPATNAATITVIGKSLGRNALIVYLASIIGGALLFGILINEFVPASWLLMGISEHAGHQHEMLPFWLQTASSVLLVGAMLYGYFLKYRSKLFPAAQDPEPESGISSQTETNYDFDMEQKNIIVDGMTCNHCKASVEKNIGAIEGIDEVSVDLATKTVKLKGDTINLDTVKQTIGDIGYEYLGEDTQTV